jgi:hypothetical protein
VSETKWCQNPECPQGLSKDRLRGVKGHKYYQSRTERGYGNKNFCTQGCENRWWELYGNRAIDYIGRIKSPIKIPAENAWAKDYSWQSTGEGGCQYYIANALLGEKIPITEQQYDSLDWRKSDDCTALANKLRPQVKQSA